MALTDQEKLNNIKQGIKRRIMEIETLDEMNTLIQGITPVKMFNLAKSAIATAKALKASEGAKSLEEAQDLQDQFDNL